jgi:fibronectin-binding autotransporter adhesin
MARSLAVLALALCLVSAISCVTVTLTANSNLVLTGALYTFSGGSGANGAAADLDIDLAGFNLQISGSGNTYNQYLKFTSATGTPTVTFTDGVTIAANSGVASGAVTMAINGAVTVTGTVLTTTTGALSIGATGTLTTTNTGAITMTGNIATTIDGAINAAGAVTLGNSAATITFGGTPSRVANGAFSITGSTVALAGTITATSNTLTATGTSVTFNAGTYTGSGITVTASSGYSIATNAVLAGTAINLNGNGGTNTFGGSLSGTATANFASAGSLAINAAVSTSGNIAFTGAGALTIGAAVTSTSGSISIGNPVSGSTADITATASSITFTNTVTVTSGTIAAGTDVNFGANAASISGATVRGTNFINLGGTSGFGSATIAFSSAELAVGNTGTIRFHTPTTFNSITLRAGSNYFAIVTGGSVVSGPTGAFDWAVSSNTINASLFPNGINTNCITVNAQPSVSGFSVSLPGSFTYRNYVQASPTALSVASTNGGTASRCAPELTSTLDRRNDVNKGLVYYGGNVVFYFALSNDLPFGSITASDFRVTGGNIVSVNKTSARRSATAVQEYAITVAITCDGTVTLSYLGTLTGNGGNFFGIGTTTSSSIVSAKCIANIYAPCA